MGLLANDGAIIIDSVLTDRGRELLARGDGSFEIVKFAFGDDEIDYTLFNATTGSVQQDLDILNTPLFESFTDSELSLKNRLISIADSELQFIPVLDSSNSTLTLGEKTDSVNGKTLEFKQSTKTTGKNVPTEIQDSSYIVFLNDDLLFVDNEAAVSVTQQGVAQYVLPRTAIAANKGSKVGLNVSVRDISKDTWNELGVGTVGSRTITTQVEAQGVVSGLNTSVTITINEEISR